MIVSTCMIVPVYMHNWQGCCVMIQPIQLQWTNRYLLLVLCTAIDTNIVSMVQQLAAQVRPQMFHITDVIMTFNVTYSDWARVISGRTSLISSLLLRSAVDLCRAACDTHSRGNERSARRDCVRVRKSFR